LTIMDSENQKIEEHAPVPQSNSEISTVRKISLLCIFCLAQFLDVFNFAAMFVAIPAISEDLNITAADSIWIVSAFQLTFASFLLVSGRVSDIYDPKYCFIAGTSLLGIMSLGIGFVKSQIPLFVLRALAGIGASLTIPSAFGLIVRFFPNPNEQAIAIGAFGGSGAVGNALGVIFSALFIERATWHWLFWFTTILSLPIGAVTFFLVPARPKSMSNNKKASFASLDAVGVSMLTIALILFIFALTSAPNVGWGTARVLAPLIISIFMIAGFLFWETRIPEEYASLPPRMWFYPNFGALFGISLSPYLWWTATFYLITTHWQEVFGWSALKAGVHFLPIGIPSLPLTIVAGYLTRSVKPKFLILAGGGLLIAATAMSPYIATSATENHYWRFGFPAFILGTCGATLVYCGASVAMFQVTPPAYAATVGAIFNAALQLGAAVGSAIIASIQASVSKDKPADSYDGRAAGFWFLLAVVALMTVCVLIFYRADRKPVPAEESTAVHTPESASERGKESTSVA